MDSRSRQSYLTQCLNGEITFTTVAREIDLPKAKYSKKRDRKVSDANLITHYAKFKSHKSDAIAAEISVCSQSASVATTAIAYRTDKDGAGAVFDHQTFQLVTDRPTAILNASTIPRPFDKSIRERPNFLKFGVKTDTTNFLFPPVINNEDSEVGLLVVPGVSADSFSSADYKIRHEAEKEMIRKARLRGQPILGICGGCWTLYQQYDGKITSVEGHAYRGGMPRLSKNDSVVSNNKPIHRLNLMPGKTLLQAALGAKLKAGETLTVNSVHSYAPCGKAVPQYLIVSATALGDATLIPTNAKPTEENSIEAFEAKDGAPVLGVQWHPEAYDKNTEYGRLVQYMTQAGQAYKNKRAMLADFVEHHGEIKLKATRKVGLNNTVIKKVTKGYVNFSLYKFDESQHLRHEDEARLEAAAKLECLRSGVAIFGITK